MISKTGGVLRDLFKCITAAAYRAEKRHSDKIDMNDALYATNDLKSDMTRLIEINNYPFLVGIHNDEGLREVITDTEMLLKMMQAMVVLEYNGKRWHDLHP